MAYLCSIVKEKNNVKELILYINHSIEIIFILLSNIFYTIIEN